jgi:hypothetical protein
VAQDVRRGSRGLVLVVVLVMWVVILPGATGQPQHSPRSQQKRFARAADKAFREGLHATLPPHLSSLLGVSSQEQECPVMQSAVRTGKVVQGFDVSTTNQNDIVLFVVNEAANDQTLYLTSPEGTLRRVVLVKAGVGDVVRIADKDKKAFAKEKQFWLDRLAPVSASK